MSKLFEEVFERSPVANILVQKNGNIYLINKQAEALFKYNRNELIGNRIEILIPESVRASHADWVQDYVSQPETRKIGMGRELIGVTKESVRIPVEVGLNPMNIDGELFIMASVIDITDRKKAEERFRLAVDASPNGMLMVDRDRTLILVNSKIEEIFGYTRDELIGKSIEILVPDEFKEVHPKLVKTYLHRPEARNMGIGRELFGRHKSGKLISVEIGLRPISVADGTYVIGSVVDISHRKAAEQEIKRKTEELESFSYRTSHDLRMPLKTICGMAECIAEDIDENKFDDAKSATEKIKTIANSLIRLTEDIMMLTKVETSDEATGVFNFEDYIELFKKKYDSLIQGMGVNVETFFQHSKDVNVQPTRLSQILDNLLSNSIKYCDKGKGRCFVKLQVFSTPNRIFIQVIDNGIGIPAARQGEVFGMFKRFHNDNSPQSAYVQGNGLGLYLIKKQVDKLNAKITFESSDKGTAFNIELPILQ